jgi:hypothetical protein
MSCVDIVCTVILILLEIGIFCDTVHICKLWVINYCISSIEHNVFDMSVCGLCECAAQLMSVLLTRHRVIWWLALAVDMDMSNGRGVFT